MFNIDTSLQIIRYVLSDYSNIYTPTNNVWRVYGNHLVRLSICPSICSSDCPFVRLSARLRCTKFLLRDIEHDFTQRLLVLRKYVMILIQCHLSRVRVTRKKNANLRLDYISLRKTFLLMPMAWGCVMKMTLVQLCKFKVIVKKCVITV